MVQIVTGAAGLVALGLFLFLSVQKLAPAIETDLSTRASVALSEAEIHWASATLDGRELTLIGEAPDASLREQAARTARVWGVRTVDNQIAVARAPLLPPAQPSPHEESRRSANDELTADACLEKLNYVLSSQQIQFESGSSEIKENSHPLLRALAELSLQCSDVEIEIGGHTDAVGDAPGNRRLSQDRAEAVLRSLTAIGVEERRLSAVGYGESQPIADNSSVAGRARNRRIEFSLGGE